MGRLGVLRLLLLCVTTSYSLGRYVALTNGCRHKAPQAGSQSRPMNGWRRRFTMITMTAINPIGAGNERPTGVDQGSGGGGSDAPAVPSIR
jgi:hypothetical protein